MIRALPSNWVMPKGNHERQITKTGRAKDADVYRYFSSFFFLPDLQLLLLLLFVTAEHKAPLLSLGPSKNKPLNDSSTGDQACAA